MSLLPSRYSHQKGLLKGTGLSPDISAMILYVTYYTQLRLGSSVRSNRRWGLSFITVGPRSPSIPGRSILPQNYRPVPIPVLQEKETLSTGVSCYGRPDYGSRFRSPPKENRSWADQESEEARREGTWGRVSPQPRPQWLSRRRSRIKGKVSGGVLSGH